MALLLLPGAAPVSTPAAHAAPAPVAVGDRHLITAGRHVATAWNVPYDLGGVGHAMWTSVLVANNGTGLPGSYEFRLTIRRDGGVSPHR